MSNVFRIFGLHITSVIPLPALSAFPTTQETVQDIVIEFGETPITLSSPLFKGVRFQAAPGELLLCVDRVARYHVQNGSRITITPENGAKDDDILLFLMGSAMGALLHQRNILALHAGAVEVGGRGVIFAGASGVGKSTLTAAFHRRGYPFLADDVCAITVHNGTPSVFSGFPRLKLWADALNKLGTGKKGLENVRWSGNLEKYYLPVKNTQQAPIPVQSVFILETTNTNKMEIAELQGGEKIDPIITNTYRKSFQKGLGGKSEHFMQCAALAAKADVFRVVRPKNVFLLDELMDLLESRFSP